MGTLMKLSRRSLMVATAGLLTAGNMPRAFAQSSPARNNRAAGANMLRLIANENPYGPSPAALAAAEKAAAEGWKYAIRETDALKKLIARAEGVATNNIMVSAGSTEALRVAALVYGRHGGRVVAALPTFSFLPGYAHTLGCEIDTVPLDDEMRHDLKAMESAVSDDTRLIYVCNPNNPTG